MIEIVTHCFAGQLGHYAQHLKFQLTSLLDNPPPCPVRAVVCCCPADVVTMEVVRAFETPVAPVVSMHFDLPWLGRRSIGRNAAALNTAADLVWFCDVDHVFGPGCLASLWEQWRAMDPKPAMVWPHHIKIHRDHATGDAATARAAGEMLARIDPAEFVDKSYNRAIGGIQIVAGDFARKWGYLPTGPYQEPRRDDRPFGDFRDDIAYRNFVKLHGEVRRIELPNLFRIRHSTKTHEG